jgi:hypothetical protein
MMYVVKLLSCGAWWTRVWQLSGIVPQMPWFSHGGGTHFDLPGVRNRSFNKRYRNTNPATRPMMRVSPGSEG